MPKALRAAEVVWEDAAGCSGWHDGTEAQECVRKSHRVRSVGLVVSRSKRLMTLALSQGPNGQIGDMLKIPTGMVRKVRILRHG